MNASLALLVVAIAMMMLCKANGSPVVVEAGSAESDIMDGSVDAGEDSRDGTLDIQFAAYSFDGTNESVNKHKPSHSLPMAVLEGASDPIVHVGYLDTGDVPWAGVPEIAAENVVPA